MLLSITAYGNHLIFSYWNISIYNNRNDSIKLNLNFIRLRSCDFYLKRYIKNLQFLTININPDTDNWRSKIMIWYLWVKDVIFC